MNQKNKGLEMNFENLSEEDLFSEDEDINNYVDNIPDGTKGIGGLPAAAERRAHHNALERKRRDHIKDSFSSLRDAVPTLKGDKVKASRAQILKKAADYIGNLKQRNESCESDIEEILKQNKALLEKVRTIETQAQANGIPLPPSLKGELSTPPPSTPSVATTSTTAIKPLSQSKSTPTITTLQRTITSGVGGGGGASIGTAGATSVITGGSGTVKLDSNGKATTNGSKIILLNNSWRSATTNETRSTVVIPTGSSRLVANSLKNSATVSGTASGTGPSKIIVQNPQHIMKREHSDKTGNGTTGALTQHVIQLASSGQNVANGTAGNGGAQPIIISSNTLSGPGPYYFSKVRRVDMMPIEKKK